MFIVPRVLFYPTLGYNVVMSKFTSREWYNRVDKGVLIGALPLKGKIEKIIHDEKIKAVLSVNESYELKLTPTEQEWAKLGVQHRQIATEDMIGSLSNDNLRNAVDFIQSHASKDSSVYVHCKAGRTRSAMVVICYLMKAQQLSPQAAHSHLKKCRPHIWLRKKQWNSIMSFQKFLSETKGVERESSF